VVVLILQEKLLKDTSSDLKQLVLELVDLMHRFLSITTMTSQDLSS